VIGAVVHAAQETTQSENPLKSVGNQAEPLVDGQIDASQDSRL
jgi:hypothetical protein